METVFWIILCVVAFIAVTIRLAFVFPENSGIIFSDNHCNVCLRDSIWRFRQGVFDCRLSITYLERPAAPVTAFCSYSTG
jgi:hypothetical protein